MYKIEININKYFLLFCLPIMVNLVFMSLVLGSSVSNESDLVLYSDSSVVVSMVRKLNHGNRVVHDMCESLEEKYSYISGSNKPSCRYNVSYLNGTEVILYKISEPVREFLLKEKKVMCKEEKMECGSLTVIIKLLDLVNSAVDVSINGNNIGVNMDLIEFDVLFETYISALENTELLTNITLSRTKSNLILSREKEKLKAQMNRHGVWRFGDTLSIYIGEPIKDSLVYIGSMLGSTLGSAVGSTIDGVTPSVTLGYENKIIVVLLGVLIFWRR